MVDQTNASHESRDKTRRVRLSPSKVPLITDRSQKKIYTVSSACVQSATYEVS